MQCQYCASSVDDNAKFCGSCGNPVTSQSRPCNKCQTQNSVNSKFCQACGNNLQALNKVSGVSVSGTKVRKTPEFKTQGFRAEHKAVQDGVSVFILPSSWQENTALSPLVATIEAFYLQPSVVYFEEKAGLEQVDNLYQCISEVGASRDISSVTILADTDLIPHFALPDLTKHDTHVLTDNPFGFFRLPELAIENVLVPEFPVSRVPFDDPQTALTLLDKTHAAGQTSWKKGCAVTAEAWRDITEQILASITDERVELHQSPLGCGTAVKLQNLDRIERLHVNLHGANEEPFWYGECVDNQNYPVTVTPENLMLANDSVVIAECCYGAKTRYQQIDGSVLKGISPTVLSQKTNYFIGSTIIAWGAINGGQPSCADELTKLSWQYLNHSGCAVSALHSAKETIAQDVLINGASPSLLNTLLSFVSYGFPVSGDQSQSKTFASSNSKSPVTTKSLGSRLDQIRQSMGGADRFKTSGNSVDELRTKLAKRLANCKSMQLLTLTSLKDLLGKVSLTDESTNFLKGNTGKHTANYILIEFQSDRESNRWIKWQTLEANTNLNTVVMAELEESGQLKNVVQARCL